jgi:hypothetical protein
MLDPNHTLNRATNGGFFVPKEVIHIKKASTIIQSIVRKIQVMRLVGHETRRNENELEIMSNATPIKNDHRSPTEKTIKPAINNAWLAANLMSIFFIAFNAVNYQQLSHCRPMMSITKAEPKAYVEEKHQYPSSNQHTVVVF